jgi:hypothetical protein
MQNGPARLKREYLCNVLAGLETGVLAGAVLLVWFALSSVAAGRSAWAIPGRLAAVVYRSELSSGEWMPRAVVGAAVEIAGAGLIGILFGIAVRPVHSPRRILLLGLLSGLGWYYCWRALLPRGYGAGGDAFHPGWPALIGHLLFGMSLALYPRLLRGVRAGLNEGG